MLPHPGGMLPHPGEMLPHPGRMIPHPGVTTELQQQFSLTIHSLYHFLDLFQVSRQAVNLKNAGECLKPHNMIKQQCEEQED